MVSFCATIPAISSSLALSWPLISLSWASISFFSSFSAAICFLISLEDAAVALVGIKLRIRLSSMTAARTPATIETQRLRWFILFLQSCAVVCLKGIREALMKSARADGERFCAKRKYEKWGNTVCIFHFSYCTIGVKDPPFSRRRFIQRFLRIHIRKIPNVVDQTTLGISHKKREVRKWKR